MADKSAANVVAAIDKSRDTTLRDFITPSAFATSVKRRRAIWQRISVRFEPLMAARRPSSRSPRRRPGAGRGNPRLFEEPHNRQVISELRSAAWHGRSMRAAAPARTLRGAHRPGPDAATLARDEAKAMLEAAGASVTGGVSKKDRYVVAGTDPAASSRSASARRAVIDENGDAQAARPIDGTS